MNAPASGSVDYLERISRLFTITTFAIAVVTFTMAPLLAIAWQQQPFPGFLLEQTLVVNGLKGEGWGGDLLTGITFPERISRVTGQPIASTYEFNRLMASHQVGDRVQIFTITPDGAGHLYPGVELAPFPPGDVIRMFWLPYFVGLAYLFIGLWIYQLRGQTRPGRALAFFCTVVAIVSALIFDLTTTHALTMIYALALAQIGGALISLAWRFPEEWYPVKFQPVILALPYLISIALGVWGMFVVNDHAHPYRYYDVWNINYRYAATGIIIFVIVMLHRSLAGRDVTVRQQARLMTVGSVVAFAPIAIWLLAPLFNLRVDFYPILFMPPLLLFPLSVAMAILRFRLLEVDDFVNRAFVYGASTAILAGVFAALSGITQRAFIAVTGAKSDAAIIITTLITATAFTPLKERVQRFVDGRLRERPDNTQGLRSFGAQVNAFVQMNDVSLLTQRLLTEAVDALHADSGILSLIANDGLRCVHTHGIWKEHVALSVPLEFGGRRYGLLQLGPQQEGEAYSEEEANALQHAAGQVARAIAMAWPRYENSLGQETTNGLPHLAEGAEGEVSYHGDLERKI